ncbi:S8 family serine peptidase [Candidatus Woesearchaeota archaeon]|nr:S8 family serine peptidase [Candidatus Woesearchaeota archaeon]
MNKSLRKKGVIVGVAIIIILILFVSMFSFYFMYIQSKDNKNNIKNAIPQIQEENITVVTLAPDEIENINSGIKPEDYVEKPIIVNKEIINATKTKEELANELSISEHKYFILQFIGPIKEEWKISLEKMNVVFYEYIPDYSSKIKVPPPQIPEILKLKFVSNIIEYEPKLKIVKDTQKKIDTLSKSEEITLYIETFKESPELKAALEEYAESYVQESPTSYKVKIESSNVNKLIGIEDINIIEEVQPLTVTNDFASDIVEADPTGNILHLNGSGQTIGIIDSGIDTGVDALGTEGDIHLDFDNRIVNISSISNSLCQLYGASCTSADDVNGHGTHTSGSIFGNGTQSSGQYRGMAYASNLTFYGAGDDAGSKSVYVSGLDTTMIQTLYNDGARTESNSWGSSTTEYSNALAKRLDAFMWDNKDILILNSAGNDGPSLQTVRDPGTAKNIITVGASQSNRSSGNVNLIASFSSRGPANDGRIKPDVVAPGTNIVSTRSSKLGGSTQSCSSAFDSSGYYSSCSGTSMAAPITSGYAALVRENFVRNLGYDSPRASLIKAMILNGAQDIGYGIPSNVTGWGRINLTNTLMPSYPRYFKYIDNKTGFTSSGQYDTHTFSVVNNTNTGNNQLKITLVWTDFESSASASTNLVNDLDLIVISPNGTRYYGNNFAWPYNGSQDRLNNVEMLILNSSVNEVETGTYTINVSAYSISQSSQDYSLVVSGGLNINPIVTKFDGATTNFGNLQNLYNKTGVVLENTTNGKIVWNGYGYFGDMNFDKSVIFASNNLYVNSSGLHSTLTTNVTVSLYNVSFAMPMPLKDGVSCTSCQIVNSTQGRVDFYTIGFSNYSSAENTSLDIWDVLDAGKLNSTTIKYQNEEIYFFANYTNFSSSLPVTSATCNITFNDTSSKFIMSYNSGMGYYQYNRTFANATLYSYNITCTSTNFYQRNSSNTTTISDASAVYPWLPINHSIVLNSNGSVTLSWNKTKNAGSYGIIYDSNVTLLWEFAGNATPNLTTSELNYTDATISAITQTNSVAQRYYKIVAMNSTARVNASNTTLGVFKKEIPATTGNPNSGVEQIIMSVPLNVSNLSLSALISSTSLSTSGASNSDVIYTYNTTTNKPESVQFFSGFGWFGDFNMFNINQGYVFKPVTSAYNITFVGSVPVANSSFTLSSSTNMAGNVTNAGELNIISFNTPQEKCDLDLIFYGASSGDMLFRYNTATAKYQTASYTASWSGEFDCINAGEGYEMRVVGNNYTVNYMR